MFHLRYPTLNVDYLLIYSHSQNFKLNQITELGQGTAAKFAAEDVERILSLRSAMFECMEYCSIKYANKKRKKKKSTDGQSVVSSHSKRSKASVASRSQLHSKNKTTAPDRIKCSSGASVVSDVSCVSDVRP